MKRIKGRPRKADAPVIDWDLVDSLLVFGEKIASEDGGSESLRYPSFADLAKRVGVSKTRIWKFAQKRNCLKRREEARLREEIKYEQKVIERRAEARALSTEEELQIIDGYLRGFKQALDEGRVRFDTPTDFNTMLRLKEFKMGNADSRQEIQGAVSLEQIQSRHKQLRDQLSSLAPSITGMAADLDDNLKQETSSVETEVYQDALTACAN